jgi:hypothetical protein
MAVIYYPKNSLLYIRDTVTSASNYESVVLSIQPNTVLYFDTSSVSALTPTQVPWTASWALTASIALNAGGTSASSSWASSSISASYAITASYLDTTLQGWWKFNNGSGSCVTDSSIFQRHGIILGTGYSWITNSYVGSNSSALSLTTNSWISLGTKIHMLGDLSLSIWIKKISADGNFPGVLGAYIQNSAGILIYVDNVGFATLQIADANSNIAFAGTLIPITGSWHHLAAIIDRTQNSSSMYMDGVKVGSGSISAVGFNESTTYWVINSRYDTNYNNHGTMYVDDARIYSRVLSQADITALYTAGPE